LKSLCGERWHPSQSLAARCRASAVVGTIVGRSETADDHDAPQANCTCGIYAVKTLHHFRSAGYERYGIHGEVYLWGTVVEHELEWRAQFAYPKNLYVPPDTLPFTLAEIRPRLQALTLYGSDIFVLGNGETISLWGESSGFDPAGLDYLIEIGKEYYVRRLRDRTLNKGDRVAILDSGIAVVEHENDTEVHAMLRNRMMLKMRRKDIAWNRQNLRWEAEGLGSIERRASATWRCPQHPSVSSLDHAPSSDRRKG
jgi:hypothetical protein